MNSAPSIAAPPYRSLLALDPDLGRGLPDRDLRAAASALRVRPLRLGAGPWRPGETAGAGGLGLLIVEGLMVREVACGTTCSAELLAAGDLIRPWRDDAPSLVEPDVAWFVAGGARVAILDAGIARELAAWPSVLGELFARSMRRSRVLSLQRAMSQVRRLDHRTLLYLWEVGERVGRMTAGGLTLRLPLTHDRLAALIGAHRPSLTAALRRLEEAGLLVRMDDHELLLTPPARALVYDLAAPRVAEAA